MTEWLIYSDLPHTGSVLKRTRSIRSRGNLHRKTSSRLCTMQQYFWGVGRGRRPPSASHPSFREHWKHAVHRAYTYTSGASTCCRCHPALGPVELIHGHAIAKKKKNTPRWFKRIKSLQLIFSFEARHEEFLARVTLPFFSTAHHIYSTFTSFVRGTNF